MAFEVCEEPHARELLFRNPQLTVDDFRDEIAAQQDHWNVVRATAQSANDGGTEELAQVLESTFNRAVRLYNEADLDIPRDPVEDPFRNNLLGVLAMGYTADELLAIPGFTLTAAAASDTATLTIDTYESTQGIPLQPRLHYTQNLPDASFLPDSPQPIQWYRSNTPWYQNDRGLFLRRVTAARPTVPHRTDLKARNIDVDFSVMATIFPYLARRRTS